MRGENVHTGNDVGVKMGVEMKSPSCSWHLLVPSQSGFASVPNNGTKRDCFREPGGPQGRSFTPLLSLPFQ